jgi:methylenetetrahydrofolate dehydrogenase (NADP+)/methenyltetrahydrofolate cyclohydrolase
MVLILDGKAHADRMLAEVGEGVAARTAKGLRAPCLAVVLVGDDPASHVYVRGKIAACARTGMRSLEHRLSADTTQEGLEALIADLNADPGVDGILVQLPLPAGLDAKRALLGIDPGKDVDGLHPVNMGMLLTGQKGLRPCTPSACISMLKHYGIALKGKRAVVLGRSEIVGKPISLMLLEEHATVTIAHSRTADLPGLCREADLLVAAVGRPGLVEGSWIKPGATVVDVGINRVEDLALGEAIFRCDPKKLETLRAKGGVLCGDVRYGEAAEVAGAITPVPGGVGPLTIAGLMANTLQACEAAEAGR